MGNPYVRQHDVLDHGSVKLLNIAGPVRRQLLNDPDGLRGVAVLRSFDADDSDVAQAARMSFEAFGSDRTPEEDAKLNQYLWDNRHLGPFEQIVVWLEMKLPIFVARQFVRHRTARLCEVSARYKQLPDEYYIPLVENVLIQSKDKKQGGRRVDLGDANEVQRATTYMLRLKENCRLSFDGYLDAVASGIAMEQARFHLHVNHYTHWLWQQDLRNLFWFLTLRDDSHAQWESRQYAKAIISLLEPAIPGLMTLWANAPRFSAKPSGTVVISTDKTGMGGTQVIQWEKDAPPIEVGDRVYVVKGRKS